YGNYWISSNVVSKLISTWGAAYGGKSSAGGTLEQGSVSYYWTLSQSDTDNGVSSYFASNNGLRPQGKFPKNNGFTLRCVKDN
ncbi:MAG: hypothetical protein LBU91_04990, partial [Bacteroidales bacterium]|nr:hypothetical protein [Bacteroidales bacterium]